MLPPALPGRPRRHTARFAQTPQDVAAAQALRHLAFLGKPGHDADPFDPLCRHGLVEAADGRLVCCFRLLPVAGGAGIAASYSAQHYDLTRLQAYDRPMAELGRFCIHPQARDPDILRLAWGLVSAHVAAEGVELLFGCASFNGVEGAPYSDAFALLAARHLAPKRWLPKVKAPAVLRFAQKLRGKLERPEPDLRRGLAAMPPLLRSYLAMGGWVSDHAVVDREMDTLHVFTGLEIGRIPPARARLLRALAMPGAAGAAAG